MFVLVALALTVAAGTSLSSREGSSSTAVATGPAEQRSPADGSSHTPIASPSPTPTPTPAGVYPVGLVGLAREALNVGGVRLSFRVPTHGWERFGDISINKSIVGPQGAEAIVYWTSWTSFPDGDVAEPCSDLLIPGVGRSAADLAAAVAAAPGTELVAGPSDATVGGRPAKHVVLIVHEHTGCDPGFFFTWRDAEVGALWSRTPVGSTIRVWVVDVGGTLIFIGAATTEQADADLVEEIGRVVRSIRFEVRPDA